MVAVLLVEGHPDIARLFAGRMSPWLMEFGFSVSPISQSEAIQLICMKLIGDVKLLILFVYS